MKQPLRAVVIGAGWAGEGQTKGSALRWSGSGSHLCPSIGRRPTGSRSIIRGPDVRRLATEARNGLS